MASSTPADPLDLARLRWRCDPDALGFSTTGELEDPDGVLRQDRAVEAIGLAIAMPHVGYNLFALGSQGLDKHRLVRRLIDEEAARRPAPHDWVYVNNFEETHKPRALAFPAGRGRDFRDDLQKLTDELPDAMRAAFQADEYQTRRQMIEQELKEHQEKAFGEIEKEGESRGIALLRTPMGLTLAPVKDGNVLSHDEYQKLDEDEKKRIESEIKNLQEKLQQAFQSMPERMKEARDKLMKLNEETADYAVGHLIEAIRERYIDMDEVVGFLDRLKQDIVENVPALLQVGQGAGQQQQPQQHQQAHQGQGGQAGAMVGEDGSQLLRRYRANLVVDNAGSDHAPVVYEDEPTYDHLTGRIEHRAEMGALLTDFHLIRPGALHRANGGFLILDARKLLTRPYAWDGLKRVLHARELKIEPLGQALGFVSTVSLDPDPIPLDVKIALVGDRMLYYLLSSLDPEFQELFKVAADFDETFERDESALADYARLVAMLARRDSLRPFAAGAVAAVLEHGARLSGDSERLSAHVETVSDVLREADHHAGRAGRDTVAAEDVAAALDAQERRNNRVRNLIQDEIRRGTILIDSDGARVGQINGLSVLSMGGYSFGRPMRITARVHLGRGDVVDIDREVELGGPIHAKGVLILGGFLRARYAIRKPLSLGASLVFEQSYGGIEGDSASVAELACLLSAIAEVPIGQNFAVTGSVNQMGRVQAIGGVNEKIEGFFDVCAARGLTGEQAILIPDSNVKHLMLAPRVLEAVEAGKFRIFAVETVDQALELLTGMPAGEPDAEGHYPEGTFNRKVEDRLAELARERQEFAKSMSAGEGN